MNDKTCPRIFVSSVMDGFLEERAAARKAIEQTGCTAVLIEDFPSSTVSSRNCCLDAVASCDAVVLIQGVRGGWENPKSGKLVVEEEFEHAKKNELPVILFATTEKCEERASQLLNSMSDYVNGHFRKKYSDILELEELIEESVEGLELKIEKNSADSINELYKDLDSFGGNDFNTTAPKLRVSVIPERSEFLLPIDKFVSDDLKQKAYEIGHSIGLMCYEKKKSSKPTKDALILEQLEDPVRINIFENGTIVVDIDLLEENTGFSGWPHFELTEDLINKAIHKSIGFMNLFFDEYDPCKRFTRFFFGVGINRLGNKEIVKTLTHSNNFSMSFNRTNNFIMGTATGECISRQSLASNDRSKEVVARIKHRHSALN